MPAGTQTKVSALSEAVQAQGTVEANENESWRYGSHLLKDEDGTELYVLRSENQDLDDYLGQTVTLSGSLDPEYTPQGEHGGPALLIVTDIERGLTERRSL